jgi:hypothetical protein
MVTASLLALATVAVAPVARGRRHLGTVVNDLGSEGGYDDGVATMAHLSQLLLAGRDAG